MDSRDIFSSISLTIMTGHTARPTDFCWAPGEDENWTAASVSEDNIVMVWQPTMRIWAGEDVKVDEKELESDAMEGVETASKSAPTVKSLPPSVSGPGSSGQRSLSMSISATASVNGEDN